MNLKRILSLALCCVLILSSLFPLASCGDDTPDPAPDSGRTECTEHIDENSDNKCDNCDATLDNTPDGEKIVYTVSVKTEGGMPMAGVPVYIHEGMEGFNMKGMGETNDNGIATFELPKSNNYSVELAKDRIPKGYTVDARYPMSAAGAAIKLRSEIIKDGTMPTSYKLGDVMHDFTITDVNGVSFKLSDILGIGEGKKQMVMLNFWFSTCSPCISEFPYINDNSQKFLEDAMVFAINDNDEDQVTDYAGATVADRVQTFASTAYFGEDPLTMPLFKYSRSTSNVPKNTMFQKDPSTTAYPTTVVIDRYGVIAFMHSGSITSETAWYKMFSHFTAEKYEQMLVTDYAQLNPPQVPTSKWEGSDTVADAFIKDGNEINVTFSPETGRDEEFAWHFNTATYGEGADAISCIKPMNSGIESSFAIMYAEVSLKPGQAVAFDYLSSTQNGYDILYVLVDGKDIYSISGNDTLPAWKECCAYVDPRPITESNKDQIATYTVSFVYQKDSSVNAGDDTVYLKDLRVIGVDEITSETLIFRYAATDKSKYGNGFDTYVTFVLGTDGYYHVGTADGPLLLADHLGYTLFDPENFISNRLANANNSLIINDKEMYNVWLTYGNCASNSDLHGLTPVTEELRVILDGYVKKYASDLGYEYDENLWLSLCVYYDAYGYDKDGNPTAHLQDPIKGLATFSAYKAEFTPEAAGDKASFEVSYSKPVMPRGYLYEFVPTVSGVYRVNSKSAIEVIGWILIGTSQEWMLTDNERTAIADFEIEERYNPYLWIRDDENHTITFDDKNVSLVAYMEAGKSYYIDICYYDIYQYGTIEFDILYEGETKTDYFVMASPGPLTYIESSNGGISQPIAIGIDYAIHEDGYVHHVIERDASGNVTKWGNIIYADFSLPSTYFTSQSIEQLIKINAFNFAIDELDRDALVILENIRLNGKAAIINRWVAEDTSDLSASDKKAAAEQRWADGGYSDIIDDLIFDPDNNGTYDDESLSIAEEAKKLGEIALMKTWAVGNNTLGISELLWNELDMDMVARYPESSSVDSEQLALYNKAKAEYDRMWEYYRMADVTMKIYHAEGAFTDRDIKALEYAEIYKDGGESALETLWNEDFYYLIDLPDGYTSRYDYLWDFYEMDDVLDPDFVGHGSVKDYTDVMKKYLALMEDETNFERQGCVAVTKELMEILDVTVNKYIFDNTLHGWLKFCYYYNDLVPAAE